MDPDPALIIGGFQDANKNNFFAYYFLKIHLHHYSNVQGGSDKSGIFFFFLLNGIIQLKISRFY